MAPLLRSGSRDGIKGEVQLSWGVSVLGLVPWFVTLSFYLASCPNGLPSLFTDAHDVKHSPIFSNPDPVSGLGTWGDPTQDFQIQDGGFKDFNVVYPIQHHIRRNFTLQPYLPLTYIPLDTEPARPANESFTPTEVGKLVSWTPGDYVGFQYYFEQFYVSTCFCLSNDYSY